MIKNEKAEFDEQERLTLEAMLIVRLFLPS
jgi:hypothetical protein